MEKVSPLFDIVLEADKNSMPVEDKTAVEVKLEDDEPLVCYLRIVPNSAVDITLVFTLASTAISQQQYAISAEEDWLTPVLVKEKKQEIVEKIETKEPGKVKIGFEIQNDVLHASTIMYKLQLKKPLKGTAQITLISRNSENVRLVDKKASITITKVLGKPILADFYAKPALLVGSTDTDIYFDVKNASTVQVTYGIDNTISTENLNTTDQVKGRIPISFNKINSFENIEIKVSNANNDSVKGSLILNYLNSSSAESQNIVKGDGDLMQIIVANDSLLALIKTKNNVYLFRSQNGIDWPEASWLEQGIFPLDRSFNGTNVKVPLEFAESASVFFGSILYLIGGSRCNTNILSSDVYFYDFRYPGSGWRKGASLPEKRAALTCVVFNGKLHALGGFDYASATDTIWILEKDKWVDAPYKLNSPLALPSAVVTPSGDLELYGGFGNQPGVADQSLINAVRLKLGESSFEKIIWDENTLPWELKAIAAAVINTNLLLVCYYRRDNEGFTTKAYRVTREGRYSLSDLNISSLQIVDDNDICPALQGGAFLNVFWLNCIAFNETLTTSKLIKFAYNPSQK